MNVISMSTLIRTFQKPYDWCDRQLEQMGIGPALTIDQARYYDSGVVDKIAEHVRQHKIKQLQAESDAAAQRRQPV